MTTKQTVSRRTAATTAAAAAGVCAIGLMLTACQSATQGTLGGGSSTTVADPNASTGTDTAAASGAPTASDGQGDGSAAPSGAATGSGGSGGVGAPAVSTVPTCTGNQIRISTQNGGAGMSHAGLVLVFTNTGSQDCTLSGYAGAALTYANGNPWNATRAMDSYLGGDSVDPSPLNIVLKPGDAASDLLGWTALAPDGAACQGTGSTALLVTAPGTTDTQTVAKGESSACANFTITPVVPGTTGSKTS